MSDNNKKESKVLRVKLSHNPDSGHFFIDFLALSGPADPHKYLVSCKISEGVAIGLSKDLGITITE